MTTSRSDAGTNSKAEKDGACHETRTLLQLAYIFEETPMSSFEKLVSQKMTADGKRCAVLVDALLDIDAVREKLTEAGLSHAAYLLDIAKLELIASLYRVPDRKLSPLAEQLFSRTAPQ